MSPPLAGAFALVLISAGASAPVSAVDRPAAARTAHHELRLTFDDVAPPARTVDGTTLMTTGATGLSATVRTHRDATGRVVRRLGGSALRLPAVDRQATGATAEVVAVQVSGDDHALEPGSSPFVFGASFRLNKVVTGGAVDNGDNLVQRGRFGSGAQYKLEVDGYRPACRVKGSDGAVQVRASHRVQPEQWYELRCRRASATKVALVLVRLGEDGERLTERWSRTGSIGTLSWTDPGVPLSVGAKVTDEGDLVPDDPDQLNGIVDDVFLDIQS